MLMLRLLLSVRGKILLSIGLLTILIVVTLWVFITSLQSAAAHAQIIDAAGGIRTSSVNIDLLTREITTTSTNNQNMILSIESVLKDDGKFIDSITRFFNGSQLVSRSEFAAFMPFLNKEFRSNRTEFPEILAAIYAPLVSGADREKFETAIMAEGFPDFHIMEWQATQKQATQPHDFYVPVNYIVPFDVNRETSFGIDLASNGLVQAVLDQTRDSGQPQILTNPPFELSHSERDFTFWIVAPVYMQNAPQTVEGSRTQLQGYLILSIDCESLVQAATGRLVETSVVLKITETNAPANSKAIFANSRLSLTSSSGLITADFPLEVLEKQWNVTLAQGIDVPTSLQKLSETATSLNQRVVDLQANTASLMDTKNAGGTGTALSDAYTKMAERNKTLQKNIQTFLKAKNNADRVGLLPALQNNALALFQSSTDFVDRLEQSLELRVEQAIQTSGIVAALALIIITAGFVLVRQLIGSLSRLNRAALSLANGHLDERVQVGTQDEIGHIGTSMNLMASQIQELINTLEQRVADRTQDLEIARRHAEQASKAKSVFLSNMSHELRTPLNVIIGYSSSMLNMPQMFNNTAVPDAHRPFIQLIEENGQYLVDLINDILDLSKIEAGKLELHCSSVDLVGIMRNVVAISVGLLKDKPIQIRQDFDDTLPQVWADPMRLRQICLNLMSNAVKFTSSGSVTLRARAEGGFVRIAVIDTGIGIPEKALASIFDRFEQATHDTNKQYGGTGLGLDISKQLCVMHGGEMAVESIVGQGSTFSFTIPVSKVDEQLPAGTQRIVDEDVELFTNPVSTDNLATILVVEDDTSMCELLRMTLESAGHVVVELHDGENVQKTALGLLPSLIILDIHLPDMDGWEVLAELKNDLETAPIPVIVCTVDESPERADSLGAALYLKKPVTAENVLAAVGKIINYGLVSS
jgi:signal transduction histidine kinase/CHASE1-domain containing sensor protein/ActR/RegA family two-component response regulator